MRAYENAFILSLRDISISSKLKASELEEMVGIVTSEESKFLDYWNMLWKHQDIDGLTIYYASYSDAELKVYFELKTGHSFPIPLSFLGTKSKHQLISYYIFRKYPVFFSKKIWNADQKKLFNSDIKGIVVVNASAGTGKTSCANERAFLLRDEGVLLISYTNEAINHNYSTLHEYPGTRGILGKKDYEKKLNVITTDSLAGRILGTLMSENHDQNIRSAIEKIQNDESIYSMFSIPGRGNMYKHIIVDETQDIDDLRGELIMTFFRMLRVKSLCLFGDPRQRIREGCGQWYSQLWEQTYSFPYLPERDHPNVERIGFTYSYRFQNPALLELANILSMRRMNIHHTLESNIPMLPTSLPIEFIGLTDGYEDNQLENVASYIKNTLHLQHNVPYSEIVVVGPSLMRNNKTSSLAKRICTIFKDYDIPCYTNLEGSYHPRGILFSTIHSIKGKEFDYVFVYGISNYPNSFHMIPYSEAESLIYVLHTRARKKMYYLASYNNFELPRGVHQNMLLSAPPSPTKIYKMNKDVEPEVHNYIISEVCNDFGINKLLSSNGFKLISLAKNNLVTSLYPPPNGINSRFWGIFCGMGVQMALTNSYLPAITKFASGTYINITKKDYESFKRKGLIVNGKDITTNQLIVCNDGINLPRPDEIDQLKIIMTISPSKLSFKQLILLTQIYDYILGDNMTSRYDISCDNELSIYPLFDKIAKEIISRYGNSPRTEVHVNNYRLAGCIDIVINNRCIELKTAPRELQYCDALQAWLYSVIGSYVPVVINLQTGQVMEVISEQSIERWKYIINAYTQIRIHSELIQYRLTKAINKGFIPKSFNQNTYFVDTEFAGKDIIFDVAAINANDIYRSLVQTINIAPECLSFATSWLKQPKELFTSSPKLVEVQDIFYHIQRLHASNKVQLDYYVSPVDCSWWIDSEKVDLSSNARQDALKKGYFISGVAPPKLTDYYGSVCHPLEFQPHLVPHTALSDALMLYELTVLGFL